MDPPHPLGVAAGEVVVDGDEVNTVAGEAVEVGRQGGDEGLALAGLHLGHPAEVQRGAAHQLDVVVALTEGAHRGLAHRGERLDQDVVEGGTVVEPLAELAGLGSQLVVGQPLVFVVEGVDVGDDALQRLQLLALARTEDSIQDSHQVDHATGAPPAHRLGARIRAVRQGTRTLSPFLHDPDVCRPLLGRIAFIWA